MLACMKEVFSSFNLEMSSIIPHALLAHAKAKVQVKMHHLNMYLTFIHLKHLHFFSG